MAAKRPLRKDALGFDARLSERYFGIATYRLAAAGAEQHKK
jgi:hypothetical protein